MVITVVIIPVVDTVLVSIVVTDTPHDATWSHSDPQQQCLLKLPSLKKVPTYDTL